MKKKESFLSKWAQLEWSSIMNNYWVSPNIHNSTMIMTTTTTSTTILIISNLTRNQTDGGGGEQLEFNLKNVLLAFFLIVLGLSTILGNTFVLLAIFVDFHLRSPTHYLMGSLALADLLLGLYYCIYSILFKYRKWKSIRFIDRYSIDWSTKYKRALPVLDSFANVYGQ